MMRIEENFAGAYNLSASKWPQDTSLSRISTPPLPSDDERFALGLIARTLVGTLAIVSNMLIITIFVRYPRFRRLQSNVLITLLSLSGILLGKFFARRLLRQVFFSSWFRRRSFAARRG